MKIQIFDTVVETREILNVRSIEHDPRISWDIFPLGFEIKFIDNTSKKFKEIIHINSGEDRLNERRELWNERIQDLIKLWEQDKTSIPRLDLDFVNTDGYLEINGVRTLGNNPKRPSVLLGVV